MDTFQIETNKRNWKINYKTARIEANNRHILTQSSAIIEIVKPHLFWALFVVELGFYLVFIGCYNIKFRSHFPVRQHTLHHVWYWMWQSYQMNTVFRFKNTCLPFDMKNCCFILDYCIQIMVTCKNSFSSLFIHNNNCLICILSIKCDKLPFSTQCDDERCFNQWLSPSYSGQIVN
jgi:hypothetical protein